ncbi:uncharacterized protein VTP21DRAFT_3881 [Calcarisporiella thermophila]|uniref:uncharacterized protein n=1 Tax=Calcarisporiella thermophila TaxID=911321 RepID=UPI003743FE08
MKIISSSSLSLLLLFTSQVIATPLPYHGTNVDLRLRSGDYEIEKSPSPNLQPDQPSSSQTQQDKQVEEADFNSLEDAVRRLVVDQQPKNELVSMIEKMRVSFRESNRDCGRRRKDEERRKKKQRKAQEKKKDCDKKRKKVGEKENKDYQAGSSQNSTQATQPSYSSPAGAGSVNATKEASSKNPNVQETDNFLAQKQVIN